MNFDELLEIPAYPPLNTALWGNTGPVATACRRHGLPYRYRAEQAEMAAVVEETLALADPAKFSMTMVDAATGIGKTLAYLVPACLAAARGRGRILIGTHTLHLMQQILGRKTEATLDITAPTLPGQARTSKIEKKIPDGYLAMDVVTLETGQRVRIAQLRGLRNFISPLRCRDYANQLEAEGNPEAPLYHGLAQKASMALLDAAAMKKRIATGSGDLYRDANEVILNSLWSTFSEDTGIDVAADDIALLPTSVEEEKHAYQLAALLASQAEVVVTTHARIAISLARSTLPGYDSSEDDDLGQYALVILDEADQWNTAAMAATSINLSFGAIQRSLERLAVCARHLPQSEDIACHSAGLSRSIETLCNDIRQGSEPNTLSCRNQSNQLLAEFDALLAGLPAHDDLEAPHQTLRHYRQTLDIACRRMNTNNTYWQSEWSRSPVQGRIGLTIHGQVPGRMLAKIWRSDEDQAPLAQAVLMTSATLATPGFSEEHRWTSIKLQTGVNRENASFLNSRLSRIIQPAKFGEMRLRVAHPAAPRFLAADDPNAMNGANINPDAPGLRHLLAVIDNARSSGERVMVLTPAYSDIEQMAAYLPDCLMHKRGTALRPLLARYIADPTACLVTPAGWAGLDLPGMVPNLVITRLPYPPREQDYVAEQTALMLKKLLQGIGRCIRRADDQATVWCADPRLPPPSPLLQTLLDQGIILPANPQATQLSLAAFAERFHRSWQLDPTKLGFCLPFDSYPFLDGKTATKPSRKSTKGHS